MPCGQHKISANRARQQLDKHQLVGWTAVERKQLDVLDGMGSTGDAVVLSTTQRVLCETVGEHVDERGGQFGDSVRRHETRVFQLG